MPMAFVKAMCLTVPPVLNYCPRMELLLSVAFLIVHLLQRITDNSSPLVLEPFIDLLLATSSLT